MKETFVLLMKELGIVILCTIMGVAALAVTYFVPQHRMRENVWKSSIELYKEGLGSYVWQDIEETQLDIFTDGLIINVSYTETGDGIRDILLGTRVKVDQINPMESLYEVIALANDNYYIRNYGRYWHGYQVLLRPLLCFFTYSDIRQINMILQLALVWGLVCLFAQSKDWAFIIPLGGVYVFLSPVSLCSSLQYSPCFYIMMFMLYALYIWKGKITDTGKNYLFVLAGVLTAYFDLLTYPFITLGVPLIASLAFDMGRWMTEQRNMWKNILTHTVSWGIGYVGMWSLKWVIASLFTEENIILDALHEIIYRSGYFVEDISYLDTIKVNLSICNIKVIIPAFLCAAACIVIFRVRKHIAVDRKLFPIVGSILFVSLYPFFWYLFTKNHSCGHAYFTWRELGISVFGLMTAGVIGIRGFAERIVE